MQRRVTTNFVFPKGRFVPEVLAQPSRELYFSPHLVAAGMHIRICRPFGTLLSKKLILPGTFFPTYNHKAINNDQ